MKEYTGKEIGLTYGVRDVQFGRDDGRVSIQFFYKENPNVAMLIHIEPSDALRLAEDLQYAAARLTFSRISQPKRKLPPLKEIRRR